MEIDLTENVAKILIVDTDALDDIIEFLGKNNSGRNQTLIKELTRYRNASNEERVKIELEWNYQESIYSELLDIIGGVRRYAEHPDERKFRITFKLKTGAIFDTWKLDIFDEEAEKRIKEYMEKYPEINSVEVVEEVRIKEWRK